MNGSLTWVTVLSYSYICEASEGKEIYYLKRGQSCQEGPSTRKIWKLGCTNPWTLFITVQKFPIKVGCVVWGPPTLVELLKAPSFTPAKRNKVIKWLVLSPPLCKIHLFSKGSNNEKKKLNLWSCLYLAQGSPVGDHTPLGFFAMLQT